MYTYSVYKNNKLVEVATTYQTPKTKYISKIIDNAVKNNSVENVCLTDLLGKLEYTMYYYKNYSVMKFKETKQSNN